MTTAELQVPWVAPSLAELVAGATDRLEVRTDDAKSGATFERLVIAGERRFLKVLSHESDWIMRVTGNIDHWELKVWRAGIYHRMPACIDHAIVGMALDTTGAHPRLAILMEERGDALVPPGDEPLPVAQHLAFLDHMAAVHARFIGWRDELGLCSMPARLRFFAPEVIAPELDVADPPGPVVAAAAGWPLLAERAPELDELARGIHRDPGPLTAALAGTPATFVPGDWKLGNLGSRADGRTVLLDCAYPGEGPPCWDLAWYLALNRARIPQPKEEAIAAYRASLERHGVDTSSWWERQLGLCLTGMMATFGWEKALGDDAELAWWAERALAGSRWL